MAIEAKKNRPFLTIRYLLGEVFAPKWRRSTQGLLSLIHKAGTFRKLFMFKVRSNSVITSGKGLNILCRYNRGA
jgi:hypothetical protein